MLYTHPSWYEIEVWSRLAFTSAHGLASTPAWQIPTSTQKSVDLSEGVYLIKIWAVDCQFCLHKPNQLPHFFIYVFSLPRQKSYVEWNLILTWEKYCDRGSFMKNGLHVLVLYATLPPRSDGYTWPQKLFSSHIQTSVYYKCFACYIWLWYLLKCNTVHNIDKIQRRPTVNTQQFFLIGLDWFVFSQDVQNCWSLFIYLFFNCQQCRINSQSIAHIVLHSKCNCAQLIIYSKQVIRLHLFTFKCDPLLLCVHGKVSSLCYDVNTRRISSCLADHTVYTYVCLKCTNIMLCQTSV